VITNAPKGMEVDHINHDQLDNRRANLRVCTHKENGRNSKASAGTSQYKGVFKSRGGKWTAHICVNYQTKNLGTFVNEAEAAYAYDCAAQHYFGEFAHTNFSNEDEAMQAIVRGSATIYTDKAMAPRRVHDFYPTPDLHVIAALYQIAHLRPQRICDPGAGAGVWGHWAREVWPNAEIIGVELREDAPVHRAYDQWITGSFLNPVVRRRVGMVDLIIGNPPYRYAEEFLRGSWAIMHDDAHMLQLLRIGFLAGIRRERDLYECMHPNTVYISSKRPSFTNDNRTDAQEYVFMHWHKAVRSTEFQGKLLNVQDYSLQYCTEPYR